MHRINVCFLQETKLEFVSVDLVRKIWGDDNFGFIFAAAINRSGGLLSIWEKENFLVVVEHCGKRLIFS